MSFYIVTDIKKNHCISMMRNMFFRLNILEHDGFFYDNSFNFVRKDLDFDKYLNLYWRTMYEEMR